MVSIIFLNLDSGDWKIIIKRQTSYTTFWRHTTFWIFTDKLHNLLTSHNLLNFPLTVYVNRKPIYAIFLEAFLCSEKEVEYVGNKTIRRSAWNFPFHTLACPAWNFPFHTLARYCSTAIFWSMWVVILY